MKMSFSNVDRTVNIQGDKIPRGLQGKKVILESFKQVVTSEILEKWDENTIRQK